MNLTIAITVLNDNTHKLIGPYNGCPILYVRDEDNPDKKQGLRTDEFFNYLYKNGCFKEVEDYIGTKFYLSWFNIIDGQEFTESDTCTLQDIFPLYIEGFPQNFHYIEELDEDPRAFLVWNILRDCFNYIYKANFDEMISGVDIGYRGSVNTNNTNEFVNVYRKVKERFGANLSKEKFIQSIQERLQKREKWNLTEKNINGVVNTLRNILEKEQ